MFHLLTFLQSTWHELTKSGFLLIAGRLVHLHRLFRVPPLARHHLIILIHRKVTNLMFSSANVCCETLVAGNFLPSTHATTYLIDFVFIFCSALERTRELKEKEEAELAALQEAMFREQARRAAALYVFVVSLL